MKYYVHVPLEKPLTFPDVCPFSETPSPTSTIRLKQTSTSSILPIPGGVLNSYSTTTMRIPASKKIAVLATTLGILIWMSMLGGMGICVWLVTLDDSKFSAPVLFLIGGPIVALGFRILRYFVLRRVRLKNAWNGFAELHFQSESYAKEFSDINRLALIAD